MANTKNVGGRPPKYTDPEELAEVYKMLVENSYFNGEVIVVDGGYSYN